MGHERKRGTPGTRLAVLETVALQLSAPDGGNPPTTTTPRPRPPSTDTNPLGGLIHEWQPAHDQICAPYAHGGLRVLACARSGLEMATAATASFRRGRARASHAVHKPMTTSDHGRLPTGARVARRSGIRLCEPCLERVTVRETVVTVQLDAFHRARSRARAKPARSALPGTSPLRAHGGSGAARQGPDAAPGQPGSAPRRTRPPRARLAASNPSGERGDARAVSGPVYVPVVW